MNFFLRHFRKIALGCFVIDAVCWIGVIVAIFHFVRKAW